METSTLSLSGTPNLMMFLLIHPYLSFFAFCFLILCIFGTITDVLVTWRKDK